jgi:hypothetical protein
MRCSLYIKKKVFRPARYSVNILSLCPVLSTAAEDIKLANVTFVDVAVVAVVLLFDTDVTVFCFK